MAAANEGDATGNWLELIVAAADAAGVVGTIATLPVTPLPPGPPWQQGLELARRVRAECNLGGTAKVPNELLGELLGMNPAVFSGLAPQKSLRASLAVRDGSTGTRFVFRRVQKTSRRFEAARLLAEGLVEPSARWLPSTDSDTAHQKRQRTFAAEFLAPIELVKDRLGANRSSDAIEELAEDLDVGPLVIQSQLANNRLISPDDVPVVS